MFPCCTRPIDPWAPIDLEPVKKKTKGSDITNIVVSFVLPLLLLLAVGGSIYFAIKPIAIIYQVTPHFAICVPFIICSLVGVVDTGLIVLHLIDYKSVRESFYVVNDVQKQRSEEKAQHIAIKKTVNREKKILKDCFQRGKNAQDNELIKEGFIPAFSAIGPRCLIFKTIFIYAHPNPSTERIRVFGKEKGRYSTLDRKRNRDVIFKKDETLILFIPVDKTSEMQYRDLEKLKKEEPTLQRYTVKLATLEDYDALIGTSPTLTPHLLEMLTIKYRR